MGTYNADIAKYIPGLLDLIYQGIIEDIDTKEKAAHISHKDMEQLEEQRNKNNSSSNNNKQTK